MVGVWWDMVLTNTSQKAKAQYLFLLYSTVHAAHAAHFPNRHFGSKLAVLYE